MFISLLLLIIQLNLAILDEFIDNKSPFYDYLLNIDHFFVARINWGSNKKMRYYFTYINDSIQLTGTELIEDYGYEPNWNMY